MRGGGGGQCKARGAGADDGKAISGLTTYAACMDVVDVVAVIRLPPNNDSILLLRPPPPPTHCHSLRCPHPNSITATATIAIVTTKAQTAATTIHAIS